MGRLYVLTGKSACGKDSIEKALLADKSLELHPIVTYTTRPIRNGETEGIDYHFSSDCDFDRLRKEGKVIEYRTYNTVFGDWTYFTVDDGQIDLSNYSSIIVGTLDSVISYRKYFGDKNIVPIYIELDDGERLQRALNREKCQSRPKYDELCRRFLADRKDFSEENIKKAGISCRFENIDTKSTAEKIAAMIKGEKNGR
ncbi:MAG: guanylate kinase [Lachnospiraceae bacterium]|uniref:Guanylate kinase n=1 Tax=Candidatus Weimeria bifida TaxID=2599074 RepID=A0A6N7J0D2_9FIRM|nr:guanylate kinase [Candidatus Weimeria bifida]RRF95294.1 MAG: guanylate kinase [Lachnospiraceae bacterium]